MVESDAGEMVLTIPRRICISWSRHATNNFIFQFGARWLCLANAQINAQGEECPLSESTICAAHLQKAWQRLPSERSRRENELNRVNASVYRTQVRCAATWGDDHGPIHSACEPREDGLPELFLPYIVPCGTQAAFYLHVRSRWHQ